MKKNRLLNLLVVLMTSCSGVSSSLITSTPEIPATVSPTSLPVTPTATTQAQDRPLSAILARMYPGSFLLLGGMENDEWLSPDSVIPHLLSGEMYQTFGALGVTGSAKGNAPEYDPFCKGYRVETDSYPFGGQAVAVTGDWNVTPRMRRNCQLIMPYIWKRSETG